MRRREGRRNRREEQLWGENKTCEDKRRGEDNRKVGNREEDKEKINATYGLNFDWYLCDEKALKTVVRSNPGILELQKGNIILVLKNF